MDSVGKTEGRDTKHGSSKVHITVMITLDYEICQTCLFRSLYDLFEKDVRMSAPEKREAEKVLSPTGGS